MNRYWVQLLWCFLLSAGLWLIHNLSQDYVSMVSVPIIAESNIAGRTQKSTSDATITAQVGASGFRHATMSKARRKPITVYIEPEAFYPDEGDYFRINNSELFKYASKIFGEGVTVESFVTESSKFLFPRVNSKKVPVAKVHTVSFDEQYTATSEMQLVPDSVYVYGEASRLENIEMIRTRPIKLLNLKSNANGKVRLDIPVGIRLSDDEVVYSLEVSRFVELSETVDIEVRNVPSNVNFEVLPSSAQVVFRSVFPVGVNPAKRAVFYVDYKDYQNSLTGRCLLRCDNLPSSVISYKVSPEVVDCLVNVR